MADRINARFFVTEVTKYGTTDNVTVKLRAAVRGSEDNKDWAKYTPSGELTMSVNNPTAAAWFEERLGRDVAIAFSDIPTEE